MAGGKLPFKEAFLHDMAELDPNKAYPMPPKPGSGCFIHSPALPKPIPGTIVAVTSHYVSDVGGEWYGLDWISADGTLRGTASESMEALVKQKSGPIHLIPDSMIKTYSHPDHYAPGSEVKANYFASQPAHPAADLSQIEADLAKLPQPSIKGLHHPDGTVSPLQAMKGSLLSPEDIKKAMELLSETTGKTFSNAEQQFKLTQEQMTKYGEIFLDAASGEVIPIGAGEIKLAHDNTPIGKLHEYKLTEGGLEASFTMEGPITETAPTFSLTKNPKKIKNKKLQEANDKYAMSSTLKKAAMTLFEKLSPDGPQQVMGATHMLQLPNGNYYDLHLSLTPLDPSKKEDAP